MSINNKEKNHLSHSLYHLLMVTEKGKRLGFWKVGNGPDGCLLLGVGDKEGSEFWIHEIRTREASEFEVKAIKKSPANSST